MNYVLRGEKIPAELRANTLTSDVGAAIPTHLVNKIIEAFDNVGMIIPLINKTAYAAGISIPVSAVKPVATWVAEGATSDKQKKSVTNITFTYHKLRCEVSMSMEVGTMALEAFEAKFVDNVAKAMIYAIENAIVNGSGEGQPKGILTETAPAGQALSKALSYEALCEVEAALPDNYENSAKLCMNKKTFWAIQALSDDAGHPIARVNYGIGGKPERFILGREVVVSPYVPEGKLFAFDFADYILNTIYDMGITKKQDWDTEDLLTKAVMSVDGKVVDKASLVTLTIAG
jgi:HK97 family phage major capsid protein